MSHLRSILAAGVGAVALSACGGGGSSTPPPVVAPPPPMTGTDQPTFTAGQFAPSSDYENRCEVVRTDTDINGNPWPDQAGTDLEERYWLRSWSNETYLWYDEIIDTDPAIYDSKFEHFDALKTDRRTASGKPVDEFHFFQDTDDYQRRSSGGPAVSYGVEFAVLQPTTPRDVRVAFVFDDTAANGLERGMRILEVDGVDLVNDGTEAGVGVINAGIFPSEAGQEATFLVQRADSEETETITVGAAELVEPAVIASRTFDIDDGEGGTTTAGYLKLTTFSNRRAERELFDAFTAFEAAGVEELFLDLRYNGGGFLDLSGQLAYMIAGEEQTDGKTFYELQFNDKRSDDARPTPFWNQTLGFDPDLLAQGQPLPSLDLDGVSILSTDSTCSASEAVINGLAGVDMDVNLIGGTTCGKPFGFLPTGNCGTTWFTVQFAGVNDKGFGDYADGFKPVSGATARDEIAGCFIADDYDNALGDVNEAMLSTAITRRVTGACPAAEEVANAKLSETPVFSRDDATAIGNTPELIARRKLERNLIID